MFQREEEDFIFKNEAEANNNESTAGNSSSSASNKYRSKEEKEEAETNVCLFRLESFSVVDKRKKMFLNTLLSSSYVSVLHPQTYQSL